MGLGSCGGGLRSFGCFLCLALRFIARIILWADTLIVRSRFEQLLHVIDTSPIRCQLEVVIHDDRVKRTIFCAEATVHANIHVDVELGWLWDRASRIWVV